jgi:putative ABC transport system substrate-binding protein
MPSDKPIHQVRDRFVVGIQESRVNRLDRMTTRRELLVALAAGALAAPSRSFAQQPTARIRRIGSLGLGSGADFTSRLEAFRAGLRDLDYVEGKNLVIEFRWANGDLNRLPALAADLVQMKVEAILAISSMAVEAARKATASIPIVMTSVGNPVGSGFVASLAHPGGNITGLTNVSIHVSSKYVELRHEAAPKLSRVAVLSNPIHPNHPTVLKQVLAGAKALGVAVSPIEVPTIDELGAALAGVLRERANALIVPADPTFQVKGREIAEFASKNRLPTIFANAGVVEAGGLLGYESNGEDMFRRAGSLTAKILNGAKPADLPVEFPTRFELVVNLKTAKALGLTLPHSLLISADKVIQ